MYGECECFVMQIYVSASCGSSQCSVLHNLQFVNAGCCCCMPISTILVVNPGSPGLESSVLVSS